MSANRYRKYRLRTRLFYQSWISEVQSLEIAPFTFRSRVQTHVKRAIDALRKVPQVFSRMLRFPPTGKVDRL
jgi:hypothetical protein